MTVSLPAAMTVALKATFVMLLALLAAGATRADEISAGGRTLKGGMWSKFSKGSYYTPTPSPPSSPPPSPVTSPRPGIWGFKEDIHEALKCQLVYTTQYGGDPNRLRAALGPACQESTLSPIQCCVDSVKLLNSPDLYGCICNNIVYQQLCSQLNVAGQTCETLLPTLKACGLQCPQ